MYVICINSYLKVCSICW